MKRYLYLTKTDTAIGFISQDSRKIDVAKERGADKHYIRAVNSNRALKSFTRVPNRYKNMVRRSKQTTFIMPNGLSFRVIKDSRHSLLMDRLIWAYSSSANLTGREYSREYAEEVTEVIISEPNSRVNRASKIYRLGLNRIKKIR